MGYRSGDKMQRVKNKSKKKKILMGTSEIDKLKRDVTHELLDRMGILILSAVVDEVGLTDEQVGNIVDSVNRYAGYIENGFCTWEDIRKDIEKNTGVSLKNWR